MLETTDLCLQNNKAIWSPMPAFVTAVGLAEAGITVIRQKQAEQAATGDTEEKENARGTVEALLITIGSQLSALASVNNDPQLAAKVNFDKSTLHKMAVSDFIITANAVSGAANDNSAILASGYMIPAADLATLSTAIPKLSGLKDAPRVAIGEHHVATLSLPAAIRYTRGIFRTQIDKMMEVFKASQPDFYAQYFTARIIIDRPGSHKGKKSDLPPPSGGTPTPPAK
ncbi:MAG TPA: hypothetical protein VHW03_02885 [Chthoniobacterales bacterium]|nr:hypothetical protein [Chthoniobacterales bacterium]